MNGVCGKAWETFQIRRSGLCPATCVCVCVESISNLLAGVYQATMCVCVDWSVTALLRHVDPEG